MERGELHCRAYDIGSFIAREPPRTGAATAILSAGGFGRPMLAPPGMSPELSRALRDAFMATLRDPEFVAEVKKRQYDLEPVSADEMQSMAIEVINQPPDVIERVRKVLEN